MAEHAVVQEVELLSLSMRAFQKAKQSGRTICFKCFEEDGVVNFFLDGAGLNQHFRTMHGINAVLDSAKCKAVFQDCHCEETARVVERLGNRLVSFFCKEVKMIYNT